MGIRKAGWRVTLPCEGNCPRSLPRSEASCLLRPGTLGTWEMWAMKTASLLRKSFCLRRKSDNSCGCETVRRSCGRSVR